MNDYAIGMQLVGTNHKMLQLVAEEKCFMKDQLVGWFLMSIQAVVTVAIGMFFICLYSSVNG